MHTPIKKLVFDELDAIWDKTPGYLFSWIHDNKDKIQEYIDNIDKILEKRLK